MGGYKQVQNIAHGSTSTKENGTNNLWRASPLSLATKSYHEHTVLYVHLDITKRENKRKEGIEKATKTRRKEGKRGKMKGEEKKEHRANMRSGSMSSPEGARLLFTGTISFMLRPVNEPTQGGHKKGRSDGRQHEARVDKEDDQTKTKNKRAVFCAAGGSRGRHDRRKGGQRQTDKGGIKKTEATLEQRNQKVTTAKQY